MVNSLLEAQLLDVRRPITHEALCPRCVFIVRYYIMGYIIAGLGNPSEEYEGTRHNTGRMLVERFVKKCDASEWKEDKKRKEDVETINRADNLVYSTEKLMKDFEGKVDSKELGEIKGKIMELKELLKPRFSSSCMRRSRIFFGI